MHIWVSGLVQGVNFRYHTRLRARQLGLAGWVRNLRDGRVEIVAEGPRAALEQLLAWSAQGPPQARVTRVEHRWEPATGEPDAFEITY